MASYEIREETSNKYWPFIVVDTETGEAIRDRFPSREKAQRRIEALSREIDMDIFNGLMKADEAYRNRFSQPLPESEQPALPDEIELLSQETVGTVTEYKDAQWLVTASYYLTERDVIEIEDVNDAVVSVGWHSHLVRVQPGDKLLPTIAELIAKGEAQLTGPETVLFADEEHATPLSDLAYSDELGVYKKSKINV